MEIHKDEKHTPSQEEQHKSNVQPTMKGVQPNQAASPPPSSTSSPSHEFSFTISLSPPPSIGNNHNNKTPPPFAANIDLSPADEIFFHGHLLPLHLLSHHTPISARSSTTSLDSFITFTLKDELLHNDIIINDDDVIDDDHHENISHDDSEGKVRASKLRSLSHLFLKWIKHHHHHHHHHDHDGDDDSEYGHHDDLDHDHHDDHHHKHRIWRPRFNIVKRYMRLVKPFIHIPFVRHKRGATGNGGPSELFLRQPASFNSYTGSLRVRKSSNDSLVIRAGRRSEFSSAPVSIKTSPTNSGLLVASGNLTPTVAFKNDSTVDELQAAIQAAIAHCKNSTSLEEEGEKEQLDKNTI